MTSWLAGALLGLLAASGVVLAVRASPPMRPVRLSDRIAPYLGDTTTPSKLLARPSASSAPFTVARRLFGPALGEAVTFVDRFVGGAASVRRRLRGLGSSLTVEDFRIEQVVWGVIAMLGAALVVALGGVVHGHVDVVLVGGAAGAGLVGGLLGRDWWLSRQLDHREQTMLAEFPVVADLLALSVVAGEAPAAALQRVCRLTRGELARELEGALARSRAGQPMAAALTEIAERTTLEPFARFVQGFVVVDLDFLAAFASRAWTRARGHDPERGDVPGWVMVTVMSAILVVAILGVFEPQIKTAIGNALDSVTNSK